MAAGWPPCGTAGSSKAHAGYKLFVLPKFIGIPVFTQNGAGRQGRREAAWRHGDVQRSDDASAAQRRCPFINTAVRQGYNAIIISGNDPNAVAPALKRAMAKGVKVISYDGGRCARRARPLRQPAVGEGDRATRSSGWDLSSATRARSPSCPLTATAANQNTWIKYMKQALKTPKYKNMKLVKIVYGNDDPTVSAQQTQALLQAYPNLAGHHHPDDGWRSRPPHELQQEATAARCSSPDSACRTTCASTSRPDARRSSASGTSKISATSRRTLRTTCSPAR